MEIQQLLNRLESAPESINFDDVITVIDANYDFSPTAFSNGELQNEAGQNSGSCKIFYFAQLHALTESQVLHCFGDYYREDVLANPEADNHQNIRNFIHTGWAGIKFLADALSTK